MRRITGRYDGVEHVLLDYDDGHVECPSDLHALLADSAGHLPTGQDLLAELRVLFGATLQIREV